MYRYIANRVLLVIPTLVGAAALVFVLMRLIPGDICVIRLGSSGGNVDARAIALCHAELGLDRSLFAHRGTGDIRSAVHGRHDHRAGSLHVIVEHAVIRAVGVQDLPRVYRPKVLEMQHGARK